ncbi:hypothetical protein [Stenotrophomonas maltophilia]|uniref:hypothetical protein n=1 Tax=Stenotrophomonas maltophilia TaxID=40324 RepID=UPI0028953A54|nr:hypothetical protein [Stenotrophomonas maltophilia]MDT3501200.1 hypothetical protein [Stenotrophomonas maltophilia]
MRRTLLLLMPLVALGCSRPPSAVDIAAPAAATPDDARRQPAAADDEAASLRPPTVPPLLAAVAEDAEPPGDMLSRYMTDLLNRDHAASDAAWTFPPADLRRADDAALRQLDNVRALRLRSQTPVAVDGKHPPQLLEVPVQVRAVTADGTFRFGGWYRVQPNADGSAWQILSAQLRPSLD